MVRGLLLGLDRDEAEVGCCGGEIAEAELRGEQCVEDVGARAAQVFVQVSRELLDVLAIVAVVRFGPNGSTASSTRLSASAALAEARVRLASSA